MLDPVRISKADDQLAALGVQVGESLELREQEGALNRQLR